MDERLKKLRKALDLTQREFGERIGVKGNTIAQYELGRNEPIDAVIQLICREFNVNETWLRTGEGDMFIDLTRDEEIAAFIGDALKDEEDSFKKRLISGLCALDDTGWKVLENFLDAIQKEKDKEE